MFSCTFLVSRSAAKASVSADDLVAAMKNVGASVFSSTVIKTAKHVWTERAAFLQSNAALTQALSLGKVCRTTVEIEVAEPVDVILYLEKMHCPCNDFRLRQPLATPMCFHQELFKLDNKPAFFSLPNYSSDLPLLFSRLDLCSLACRLELEAGCVHAVQLV
jgi:hypothetical protein